MNTNVKEPLPQVPQAADTSESNCEEFSIDGHPFILKSGSTAKISADGMRFTNLTKEGDTVSIYVERGNIRWVWWILDAKFGHMKGSIGPEEVELLKILEKDWTEDGVRALLSDHAYDIPREKLIEMIGQQRGLAYHATMSQSRFASRDDSDLWAFGIHSYPCEIKGVKGHMVLFFRTQYAETDMSKRLRRGDMQTFRIIFFISGFTPEKIIWIEGIFVPI